MEFLQVSKSLFAIFILVAAGLSARKAGIFNVESKKTINDFVYYVGLPSLFFTEIAQTDYFSVDPVIFYGSVLPILLIVSVLILLKIFKVISKDRFALLVLSVAFGGNAFFGIAFFQSLYGEWGLKLAVLSASMLGAIGIGISVFIFEYATQKAKGLGFLLKVLRSPLIIATLLGIFCSLLRIRVGVLFDALSFLSRATPGVAIFSLGLFIYDCFSLEMMRSSLCYSFFRMIALPIATFSVIVLFRGHQADVLRFLALQAGIPAAVSLSIFAQRYDYKVGELSGIVVTTSALSLVSLSAIFVFIKMAGF